MRQTMTCKMKEMEMDDEMKGWTLVHEMNEMNFGK